jgi:tape measure domain-containing protein
MQRDMVVKLTITGDGKIAVQAVDQVAGAQKRLDDQQKKSAQGTKEATGAAEQYIESLRKQLRELQSNQAALRESEAISRGATKQQLEDIRALGAAIDNHGQKTGRMTQATELLANVMSMAARAAGGFAVAMAFAAPVAALGAAQDNARVLLARITGITGSLNESRVVYAGLIADSVRLRVDLDQTLQGYTRIAGAVKELGGTSKQARELNEIVITTAKASGVAQQEAAAAAVQFAQALGSGVLQGDELKSILENNQELARQLARGLGVSVGELRTLGEQGKLTADVVARALLSRLPEIRTKLAEVPLTAADAWQKLTTVFSAFITNADQVDMKAGAIASTINAIADAINSLRGKATAATGVVAGVISGLVPGAAPLVTGLVEQANAAAVARERMSEYGAEVDRLVARYGDNTLAGSQAQVTKATNDLNEAWKRSASAIDKYGVELSDLIGKINTAEAVLTAARAKAFRANESTDDIDQRLAAVARIRSQVMTQIPLELAEANKKTWDEFEKQTRIAVDRQLELLDRVNADTNAKTQVQLASNRAALEALNEVWGKAGISADQYIAKRGELAAEESRLNKEIVNNETFTQNERIALLKPVVEAVRAKYGDEAAAAVSSAKDIAEAYRKLSDLSKQRIDQHTKEAQSAAQLKTQELQYLAERMAAQLRFYDAVSNVYQGTADLLKAQREEAEQRQFELSLYGMTEEAQQKAIALRKVEIERTKQLEKAERDYEVAKKAASSADDIKVANEAYEQRIRAINQTADAERQSIPIFLEQKAQLEQQKTFWNGLFEAVKGGWKGVRDYLKNVFFDWLIQQLKQQFVLNIGYNLQGSGGIGGMLAGLFGGGGAGTAGGGIGGMLGSLLGGGSGGGIFGSLLGQLPFVAGAGPLAAGTGLAGILSNLGLNGLATGVAQLSSFIPVIGPIVAIAATLLPRLFNNKDGLWFDINGRSPGGHPENQFTTALGSTIQLHGEANIADAKPYVAQFQNLAQNFVTIFGKEVAERASAVVNQYWTGFSERGRGTEYTNAQEYAAALAKEGKDVLAEYFSKAFSVVDQRIADTISAWTGSTEDLVKYIQTVLSVQSSINNQASLLTSIIGSTITLKDVLDLQKEGEALSDTFSRILGTFSITNTIAQALGKGADAFGALGLASLEARERVVALAGGVQALGTDFQTYLDKFFSDDERARMQRELAQKQVNNAFAELNLTVPATREQFRALVSSLDLSTEGGQRTFVALMKVAGAFDVLIGKVADDLLVVNRTPGRIGPGAVDTSAADAAWKAYLDSMYTATERAALRQRELWGQVSQTFSDLGLTIPKSVAEYRQLVDSIDRTTPSGEAMYQMLVKLGPAFAEVKAAAQQAAAALTADLLGALQQGLSGTQTRLEQMFAIIDSTGETTEQKLARKMAAARSVLADLQASYASLIAGGGSGTVEAAALEAAMGEAQRSMTQLAADAARLIVLRAQYGDKAEQLLDLEHWYAEQRHMAGENADLLLIIEQAYQTRRNDIINGGVATGLAQLQNTLRDWLNNLLLNQQLTTLTPMAQLAEARSQFNSAVASGDGSAITRAADAYLSIARSVYASGADYQAIYNAVIAQIQAIIGGQRAPISGTQTSAAAAQPAISTAVFTTTAYQAATSASDTLLTSRNNADAIIDAFNTGVSTLADILGRTKYTIEESGDAGRQTANSNTDRVVTAIVARGLQREVV